MKYWIYQPYKWLILVPIFAAITIIGAVLIVIISLISANLAYYIGKLWAKTMQWLTPMPVEVSGRENIDRSQSYVVVANHESAYDIFAIYGSLGINFRWMMKQELREVPFMGYACEKMQHIFLNRSSKMASFRSIQRAKSILVGGTSVVIFPEGTRSHSAQMGPFKHGAFKMAYDLELPILPVSLVGTWKVMPGGLGSLRPGRAKLIIHEPIDTMQYLGRRNDLIAAAYNAVSAPDGIEPADKQQ